MIGFTFYLKAILLDIQTLFVHVDRILARKTSLRSKRDSNEPSDCNNNNIGEVKMLELWKEAVVLHRKLNR